MSILKFTRMAAANTAVAALLVSAVVLPAGAQTAAPAKAEKPQYGGTLSIGNVYYTVSPLSFDVADWPWKHNQDTGLTYEQLFAADLSKSKRNGGPFPFQSDAYLPPQGIRGELAEKWELKQNPWRLEVQLRKGVMFPAKAGVMASRELVAEDVVYSYDRLVKSPKKIAGYSDHVDKVEATGKYTVVFTYKYYNAEYDYRFGWGYYSAIMPKEVVTAGAQDWKNANGTGPFLMDNYIQGNSLTFKKNPGYWDTETIGGEKYKLPFADSITYRFIKDEATMTTALRTGKVDVLEAIRWSDAESLKKQVPKLQWSKYLAMGGMFVAMRTDTKPFDDIRVRRALNMAVNKPEIIKTYWGGNAELLGFPMHPTWVGYYEPLDVMPEAVKELFVYNPTKAKALLAEAGYPNGFSFKTQTTSASTDNDLLAMVAAYLAKVGVKMEIQVLEYPAFMSAMGTKTNTPGYFMFTGATNPTTSLRKNFLKGQYWNPSQYNESEFDKKMAEIYAEPDERVRQIKAKLLTREILEKAPYIWLPTQYGYTAWWPWVKNYGGELRAGSERPAPIHARMWVDQEMKKKMGY